MSARLGVNETKIYNWERHPASPAGRFMLERVWGDCAAARFDVSRRRPSDEPWVAIFVCGQPGVTWAGDGPVLDAPYLPQTV